MAASPPGRTLLMRVGALETPMEYENDGQHAESDPRRHTQYIRHVMTDLAHRARQDMDKVKDPRAQSLFERTAAALEELDGAYARFERDLDHDAESVAGGETADLPEASR